MRRKILCAALAAAMAGSLASCNEKDVDYSAGAEEQTNEAVMSETSALARALSVPEKCDITFDTGKSELKSITLKDDQIALPDAEHVYTVSFEEAAAPCTDDKLSDAIVKLMDESEGIGCRENDSEQTKAELAASIEAFKPLQEEAEASGDKETAEMFEGAIDDLKSQMETAPDELPPATEYKIGGNYVGTKDGIESVLATYTRAGGESDSADKSVIYSMTALGENSVYLGEVEGAVSTYTEKVSMLDGDISYDGENPITEEEGEEAAMEFLDLFGLDGFAPTETEENVRLWTDTKGETLGMEPAGYHITLKRQIDGMEVVYPDNSYLSMLDDNESDGLLWTHDEYASIDVDEGGVSYAFISVYADAASFDKKEVTLLSWDELLEAANESIAAYYKEHPTAYSSVEFNDVKLAYVPCPDGEGGKCFTPAWIFSQSEYDDLAEDVAATQLVYINAVDGSYIDIEDTIKALGMKDE